MAKGKESTWIDMPLLLDWELDLMHYSIFTNVYLRTAQEAEHFTLNSSTNRQRLVNLLPQKSGDKVILKQRGTLEAAQLLFNKSATVANPRGIFFGNTISRLLEFWGTVLYVWSANDTYTTVTAQGSTADGPGGFAEGINSSGTAYVFAAVVTDGTVVTASGNTAVTDADFPTSVIPMPVYLDGYIFIAQQSDRSIFNSVVGDPLTWTATGFIDTEEYGGNIVGLARVGKFVVALCENSVEFFRNAGIPAPNSPLQRVQELSSRIGCINRATIATYEDTVYFAGKDTNGMFGIYRIEKNGQINKVSNQSVDFLVSQHGDANGVYGVITSWIPATTGLARPMVAYMIPFESKWYYGIHCNGGTSLTSGATHNAPISLVYDPELKIWIEIMATHRDNSGTASYCAGGWPFPHGTLMKHVDLNADRAFIMQNAYGGTADNDLAIIGSATAYEVIDIAGGPSVSNQAIYAKNIIQWPLTDFGFAGRKTLTGVEISLSGNADMSSVFSATGAVQPSFVHHGQYFVSGTGNLATTFSLLQQDFAPPNGELVWTVRTNLVNFRQQWFQIFFNILYNVGVNSIRFRITSHEEQ